MEKNSFQLIIEERIFNMQYQGITLDDTLHITKLYTVHYFEYMSDFSFCGETHDFWEFACIDKGSMNITAGSDSLILEKDEIIFHEPNEFHNVNAIDGISPNLIVISFECTSPCMEFFSQKKLKINAYEGTLLADIIREAGKCFACGLDNPFQTTMPLNEKRAVGSGQIIRMKLELFLLSLYQRYRSLDDNTFSSTSNLLHTNSNNELFDTIHTYLNENVHLPLNITTICNANLISKTKLHRLFKDKTGLGVMDYFTTLKMEAAKTMIRSKNYNVTEISDQLGYTSVHYFSKRFRSITGMSPTQYATSIKALAEFN